MVTCCVFVYTCVNKATWPMDHVLGSSLDRVTWCVTCRTFARLEKILNQQKFLGSQLTNCCSLGISARSGFLLCSTCRGWRSYEMWPQCVMKQRSCIFLRGFRERDARSTLICRADDWRHSPWSTEISLTCPYRLFLNWLSLTWARSSRHFWARP